MGVLLFYLINIFIKLLIFFALLNIIKSEADAKSSSVNIKSDWLQLSSKRKWAPIKLAFGIDMRAIS